MKPEELLQYVGKEYAKLDENGKALGCMMPVYMLYPDIPRYEWPEEGKSFADSVMELLSRHGEKISIESILPGDVVAIRAFFGYMHIGVYLGNDLVIHCSPDNNMESFRLSLVRRSVKGVFRWRT